MEHLNNTRTPHAVLCAVLQDLGLGEKYLPNRTRKIMTALRAGPAIDYWAVVGHCYVTYDLEVWEL